VVVGEAGVEDAPPIVVVVDFGEEGRVEALITDECGLLVEQAARPMAATVTQTTATRDFTVQDRRTSPFVALLLSAEPGHNYRPGYGSRCCSIAGPG
jgi:hypothetical protein